MRNDQSEMISPVAVRDPSDPVEQMIHALGDRAQCPFCFGAGYVMGPGDEPSPDDAFAVMMYDLVGLVFVRCPLCDGSGMW